MRWTQVIGRLRLWAFLSILPICFAGCSKKKSELLWSKNIYAIGSQSSPRAVDLNQDGVLDIVMGAAKSENQTTDQGVLALDGTNGNLLWKQEADDQVFGSATFYDITDDGIADVFIGGRSPNFKALDGTNGQVIWEYTHQPGKDSILQYARFNFYNSVLVPDQNGNGFPELLTVNGGNVKAPPGSLENRFPGVLMLFDSSDGEVLAADLMPDRRESYMSPLCFKQPGTQELMVLFGTGGETISGNLYLAKLNELISGDLHKAQIIASETDHGFIAPPVLADISGDGSYDIISISQGSSIFAINGEDLKPLWKQKIPHTESSNSFGVGNFTDDNVPDILALLSQGVWPQSTGALQVMINGANGNIEFIDSLGCVGFSSPVIFDLNNDGFDEAIISINEYDCQQTMLSTESLEIEHKLLAINFKDHSVSSIDGAKGFKNVYSTPWIGDLDSDGYLDVVHCQYYSPNSNLLSFLGMTVRRISTSIKMRRPPVWGGYMGSNGDGIYPL